MGASPDGRSVLFWAPGSDSGLCTVLLSGGEPTRLAPLDSASLSPYLLPVFSPDGSRIAYLDQREVDGKPQRRWKVIPSTGGAPILSLPLGDDVEWTTDGKALTFLDAVAGVANVFRQRLDGGQPVPVTHFTVGGIRDHAWSPDGRRLLVVRGIGESQNIWMTAADGSAATQLTDFKTGRIASAHWMPTDGGRIVFTYGQESSDVVLISNR